MTRQTLPLVVEDLSAFAKSLRIDLMQAAEPPSHVTLMNMLARGAGFRNLQHLKAAQTAERQMQTSAKLEPLTDHRLVQRALQCFDSTGSMTHWPAKRSVQDLCLWVFWRRIPPREDQNEKEINAILTGAHSFGDPAILRRMLVSLNMVTRTRDGSVYRRIEQRPPPEAQALISALEQRQTG